MVGSESSKDLEIGELDPRTEMLSAVAYVATRIVGGGSWRDNVPELLERLGQATRMSRVTLFEAHLNVGGLVQSCRYDWAEPGLERISMDPRYHNMPLVQPDGTLDEWSQSRMRGETIVAKLRDVTGYTRQVFLEHGTRSFVSVPIMVSGRWWGFLGFDDCHHEREWSAAEIDVLKTVSGLIAGAIERENAEQLAHEAERRRAKLARYFSPNMVEELLSSEGQLNEPRSQTVTVLFADIWGFTQVTAALPGTQLIALLREFLSLVEEAVFENDGTLDKFLGDGLMATFGTPWNGPHDASNALQCACQMAESVAAWNRRRDAAGRAKLQIGIGLHRGEVVLGDIGSERRMEFAVVGDTVNIASRLQEMTRKFHLAIVTSEDVIAAAKAESKGLSIGEFQSLGQHELRGREGAIHCGGLRRYVRLWRRSFVTEKRTSSEVEGAGRKIAAAIANSSRGSVGQGCAIL